MEHIGHAGDAVGDMVPTVRAAGTKSIVHRLPDGSKTSVAQHSPKRVDDGGCHICAGGSSPSMTTAHSVQPEAHRPTSPEAWWRTPCEITPHLLLSGDLDTSSMGRATRQLEELARLGVTDIIDTRGEMSDEWLVNRLLPEMRYHYVATDDDGLPQPDEWFDRGVSAALPVLSNADGRVLVHCHMGVNRAPSLMFAILLATGHDPVEALTMIRQARPIAAILYALDALAWWHRASAAPLDVVMNQESAVRQWFDENPVDVSWIISRIALHGSRL